MGEGREIVVSTKFTALLKNTSTTDYQNTTIRVYIESGIWGQSTDPTD
jgi:hypothetical protein